MVALPAGRFRMGSDRFYPEESPVRDVAVAAFMIDVAPVTNRQFDAFIRETRYVTVAERPLDPSDFPGAATEALQPGALVFKAAKQPIAIDRWDRWWEYRPGAHWRRPEAKASVLPQRLDHPVVCVAYEDALAYARWAGKTLPSEAQWEYAARGGLDGADYAWGDEFMPAGRRMANTWRGDRFPYDPQRLSRAFRTTKVGGFPPNGYGLQDMIGNVWEWTRDWYTFGGSVVSGCCPQPPEASFDPAMPGSRIPRRVIKGGSFLCAPNHCMRYRPAARHPQMIDTATVHLGFRCVAPIEPAMGGDHA